MDPTLGLRFYELLLADIRAQVDRQWDLFKFFSVLSGSATGAAAGLLNAADAPVVRGLVAGLLAAGAAVAVIGVVAIRESKLYYRRLAVKKTLVEIDLGLGGPIGAGAGASGEREDDVAIWSAGPLGTRGKQKKILQTPAEYATKKLRWGSITGSNVLVLWGLAALNLSGALIVANMAAGCPVTLPCE